jgi:hypothetical protein
MVLVGECDRGFERSVECSSVFFPLSYRERIKVRGNPWSLHHGELSMKVGW